MTAALSPLAPTEVPDVCPGCGETFDTDAAKFTHWLDAKLIGKNEREMWAFLRRPHGAPVPPAPAAPERETTEPIPLRSPYDPPAIPHEPFWPPMNPDEPRREPRRTDTLLLANLALTGLLAVSIAMHADAGGPLRGALDVLLWLWEQPALAFGLCCGTATCYVIPSLRQQAVWFLRRIIVGTAVVFGTFGFVVGAVGAVSALLAVAF